MLMRQPFFIGGIDDVEVAKGSAFGAAGLFFFTFVASIFYLMKESSTMPNMENKPEPSTKILKS